MRKFYDEGWNACVLGEPYSTDASRSWHNGYADCKEAPEDDRTFMLDPGGTRPHNRPDGIPTRADIRYDTRAERAIRKALAEVEKAGASVALTRAATLLVEARDAVADHVEGRVPAPQPACVGVVERRAAKIETADGPLYAETVDGAVVHGRAPLTDAGRKAIGEVIAAARLKIAPRTFECPKCHRETDITGMCAADGCPGIEERVKLFESLSPAPSPQAGGETWQPIATAPKDGTLLIGFVPGSALYEVIFIRHWEDEDTWRHDMGNETVPMDMEPTHWMPMPEVPSLSARREG